MCSNNVTKHHVIQNCARDHGKCSSRITQNASAYGKYRAGNRKTSIVEELLLECLPVLCFLTTHSLLKREDIIAQGIVFNNRLSTSLSMF